MATHPLTSYIYASSLTLLLAFTSLCPLVFARGQPSLTIYLLSTPARSRSLSSVSDLDNLFVFTVILWFFSSPFLASEPHTPSDCQPRPRPGHLIILTLKVVSTPAHGPYSYHLPTTNSFRYSSRLMSSLFCYLLHTLYVSRSITYYCLLSLSV